MYTTDHSINKLIGRSVVYIWDKLYLFVSFLYGLTGISTSRNFLWRFWHLCKSLYCQDLNPRSPYWSSTCWSYTSTADPKTTREEISKSMMISLEGILNCWLPWELKQRRRTRCTKSGQLSTERLCTLEIQKARTQKLWTLYVRNIKSQLF